MQKFTYDSLMSKFVGHVKKLIFTKPGEDAFNSGVTPYV